MQFIFPSIVSTIHKQLQQLALGFRSLSYTTFVRFDKKVFLEQHRFNSDVLGQLSAQLQTRQQPKAFIYSGLAK